MNTNAHSKTDLEEEPLSRTDVEHLLRQTGNSYELDLSNRNLSRIDLSNFNLSGCNMSGCDLSRASMFKTNLEGSNLSKANLRGARLMATNLRNADLSDANLSHADLTSADLMGANLNGADLLGANLVLAKLNKASLSENYLGANFSDAYLDKSRLKTAAQISNIAKANPANIQEVAASQIAISNRYYENALKQSQRSFWFALLFAALGTALIFAAVIFFLFQKPSNLSYLSLAGGAIIDAVASLIFYLYARATNQLTVFQRPLDRLGRFLIANSACENIAGDLKNTTRAKLVEVIAKSSTTISDIENTGSEPSLHIARTRNNITKKK